MNRIESTSMYHGTIVATVVPVPVAIEIKRYVGILPSPKINAMHARYVY